MTKVTNTRYNVATIGLGSMRYGITSSALRAGHKVWAVGLNPYQVSKFQQDGGQTSEMASIAETVFELGDEAGLEVR